MDYVRGEGGLGWWGWWVWWSVVVEYGMVERWDGVKMVVVGQAAVGGGRAAGTGFPRWYWSMWLSTGPPRLRRINGVGKGKRENRGRVGMSVGR